MDKETLYATVGAILGAGLTKLIEKIFGLKKRELDEASAIRAELRAELRFLNDRISAVHKELDMWKAKYYTLTEEHLQLRAEYAALKATIDGLHLPGASAPIARGALPQAE